MIITSWKIQGLFKADAQKVSEEIAEIGETVDPSEIVENTELHKCFEWRDDVAAEKYRLHQARKLIGNLVFQVADEPSKQEPIRLMYKTTENEGYKSINLIMNKPDEYKALLNRAYSELQAFKNKLKPVGTDEGLKVLKSKQGSAAQYNTAHKKTKQNISSLHLCRLANSTPHYKTRHNTTKHNTTEQNKTLQAFLRDLFLLAAKNRSTQSSAQQTSI